GFCGGIAGIQCCNGYKCQLDGNYPDAGGTCMPEPGTGYLKGALKIGPICPVEIASDNFAYNTYSHEINEKGKICTQVITNARNPYNGECKEFPTPCDVPEGWVKVSSCENQCTPPPEIFMNRKIIIYRDNTKVNELELDKNLEYSTLLEPGNFIVDVTDSNGNILPLYLPRQIGEAEPIEAEVKEGETTIINFDIDTGIR
ncbi:hypothetical protein HYU11_06300, partial [Candidatus Woesearchaeota archaeon]|nr:hypothetical protein [Candidatus Woesearchaeota archaeon]